MKVVDRVGNEIREDDPTANFIILDQVALSVEVSFCLAILLEEINPAGETTRMHIQLGFYQLWHKESVSCGIPLTFETVLIIWEYTWDFFLLVDENQLFSLLCCMWACVSAIELKNFKSIVMNEADMQATTATWML